MPLASDILPRVGWSAHHDPAEPRRSPPVFTSVAARRQRAHAGDAQAIRPRQGISPDVNAALQHLEKFAQRRAEPELVYALAELSWIEGKRLDRWRKPQAIDRFLDAAAYAHDYLFDTSPSSRTAAGAPTRGSGWPARSTTPASSV